MHINMTAKVLAPSPLPCACANMRRAARAMTQLYDAALRPSRLRITQFTLLQVLERTGEPMTQGALGDLLALDTTTLSRTLRPLERAKWIRRVEGGDARERRPPRDRKSTRLNSSHITNSYAVFCLKKKKITP